MAGSIFITQGDVTEFQADAVVCPTSTYLIGHGLTSAAFARRFPAFDEQFRGLQQAHAIDNERGQRVDIGQAFWLPVGTAEERLRGIILVAVTGGTEPIAERAARSVRGALQTAREHLGKA